MKILKPFCLSMVMGLGVVTAAQAANDSALVNAIYSSAKSNNRQSLYRIKKNGYSLDATDIEGNTALCRALEDKDQRAYDLLRVMGANPRHPCVERLEAKATENSSSGIAWRPTNYTYTAVGAVVLGGAVIAAAASGGSGGGSNKNDTTTDDGTGGEGTGGEGGGGETGGGEGGEGGGEGGGVIDKPDEGDVPVNNYDTGEYRAGGFLPMINAARAYENLDLQGISLQKVKVGIIDDGVYASNKEFANQEITGFNYDYGPCRNGDKTSCWEYKDGTAQLWDSAGSAQLGKIAMTADEYERWAADYPADYNWEDNQNNFAPLAGEGYTHGTHVAGIISAVRDGEGMHGVASNAELIVVRRDMSDLSTPIVKLVDSGAKVINMSIGADATDTVNASTINNPEVYSAVSPYLDAYRYALANNTILVVAAGNESHAQSNILSGIPLLTEFYTSDEKGGAGFTTYNTLINVVALDENGRLASYSNKCGATKGYCLAAPGTNILSTTGSSYGEKSGTSMATPVVTGSIALLTGAYPYMSAAQVVNLLLETATDIPVDEGGAPDGVDEVYGHGLLNLNMATQPQGELMLAADNSVNGSRVSMRNTQITVPAIFQNSLAQKMPAKVTVFDKYNRPFEVSTASMVRKTHNGERDFKQDLYAFSRRKPRQRIEASKTLSFGFAASDFRSDGGLGFADIEYKNDGNRTSFFFSENTRYNHNDFYEKALFNPYLAMNQAYGIRNAYDFSSDLGFSMGLTAGENGLYDGDVSENDRDFDNMAYAFDTSVSYKATDEITLSAMSGVLYEDDAMLGLNGSGAFGIGDSDTYYAGLAIAWQPSPKWTFSGAYYQGWTKPKNLNSSMIRTSQLASDSFAFDGRYNMNKTDVIGFQVSSPLRVYKGTAKLNLPVGRDDYSDTVYREQFAASMKPDAREYKFSLYHSKEINEDMGLRSQFDMRINPDHQKDAANDYRVMFSFNWNL